MRTDETKLITSEASSADQKFLTSKALLHRAVSINIAALITNAKSPSVNNTAGSARTFKMDPKTLFINPKSKATQRNFQAPPLTVMPGTNAVATHTARARIPHLVSNFMP